MNTSLLSQVLQVGTGAAFILFPLIFVFAFSAHPGLLKPRLLKPEEIIRRARRSEWLQLRHSLVLLNTALLIAAAIHFCFFSTSKVDRVRTLKIWRLQLLCPFENLLHGFNNLM